MNFFSELSWSNIRSTLPLQWQKSLTFLGGGSFFFGFSVFSSVSGADCFESTFSDFFVSTSESTTKKWWHLSHLTNLVDAGRKQIYTKKVLSGKEKSFQRPEHSIIGPFYIDTEIDSHKAKYMKLHMICLVKLEQFLYQSNTYKQMFQHVYMGYRTWDILNDYHYHHLLLVYPSHPLWPPWSGLHQPDPQELVDLSSHHTICCWSADVVWCSHDELIDECGQKEVLTRFGGTASLYDGENIEMHQV